MADARIKELVDEYFNCFKIKYDRTPLVGGKDAKLAQGLWVWADKNNIEPTKIYTALHNFFADDGFAAETTHAFELFYKKINSYFDKPKKVVKKPEVMGVDKPFPQDEMIKNFELEGLLSYLRSKYPIDGVDLWVKKRDLMKNFVTLTEGSLAKKNWDREEQAARAYFGDIAVTEALKDKPKEDKRELLKKQAKELLTNKEKESSI